MEIMPHWVAEAKTKLKASSYVHLLCGRLTQIDNFLIGEKKTEDMEKRKAKHFFLLSDFHFRNIMQPTRPNNKKISK